MKAHHFCTLFDGGYLVKGVAMLESLARYCPGAHVHVLCMDVRTHDILSRLGLSFVSLIHLHEIETAALLEAKKDRGVAEYCWTLSPCLPHFVLENNLDIDFITYVDADLLFYSPVKPLFDEIGNSSIAIIEHRFSDRLKDREVNGRFCVEWVSFRRDEQGMSCLARWRDQCIEWCYYRLEEGRMGDQKYLDEWPARYSACHILMHAGAGIAPWNYSRYQFGWDGDGQITVDGAPLIFYHFHQFQMLSNGGFDRLSEFYTRECSEPQSVYSAYEATLEATLARVRKIDPGFSAGLKPASKVASRRWAQKYLPRRVKDLLHRLLRY
ncbi:MAG: hypothetical protein KF871_17400 [Hydrogenophaga sp.]|uniref:hypothetical protein n=1 Tax=Hydrogenophaga sp. TaxID=1904254 RepID=UPI001DB473B2|nr:hypothetical protein [Hydrogenophaga sp.]MBX3611675.1 hypothetical protein [Hydrogenophaga sp.]